MRFFFKLFLIKYKMSGAIKYFRKTNGKRVCVKDE